MLEGPVKVLLMILLFGKTVLLTPTPIDLSNNWTTIIPKKPLKAITDGANIEIDVTSLIPLDAKCYEHRKSIPL